MNGGIPGARGRVWRALLPPQRSERVRARRAKLRGGSVPAEPDTRGALGRYPAGTIGFPDRCTRKSVKAQSSAPPARCFLGACVSGREERDRVKAHAWLV